MHGYSQFFVGVASQVHGSMRYLYAFSSLNRVSEQNVPELTEVSVSKFSLFCVVFLRFRQYDWLAFSLYNLRRTRNHVSRLYHVAFHSRQPTAGDDQHVFNSALH